ncbi:uncharacterized protein LOC135814613 [Sycon ciliatum]|uniref:uncharacterized protein LOC135814613 n=1 Tax=Sycon ciliatum TaxID=27933 RepID=UPI0031F66BFB
MQQDQEGDGQLLSFERAESYATRSGWRWLVLELRTGRKIRVAMVSSCASNWQKAMQQDQGGDGQLLSFERAESYATRSRCRWSVLELRTGRKMRVAMVSSRASNWQKAVQKDQGGDGQLLSFEQAESCATRSGCRW